STAVAWSGVRMSAARGTHTASALGRIAKANSHSRARDEHRALGDTPMQTPYVRHSAQQEPLFPALEARPARPYRIPVYRVMLVREIELPHAQPQIRSSRDAAVLFREHLGDVDREHFLVAMLDQKNKVIGINTVSMGSLTASVVHPRECFKPAILSNAAALLL